MLKKHDFEPFLCLDTIMILFFSEKTVSELFQNKVQILFSCLTKMQMVLKDDILTKDMVMDKYKAGYEVTSFAAESFEDSVNGSLRKGDIVDVYAKDPATEMLTLMAENVYVSEVYDTAGF